MPYLVVAVVLVGGVSVLNLALALGVIRRLREHTKLLSTAAGSSGGRLAAGEKVGEFSVQTVEGETVSVGNLARDSVVAFFSPTCGPCKELAPKFIEYFEQSANGHGRPLTVVLGEDNDATAMAAELSLVSRVVRGAEHPSIVEAFAAEAFPVVYVMGVDRTVESSGHDLSTFTQMAVASR